MLPEEEKLKKTFGSYKGKLCKIKGCKNKAARRFMCLNHYAIWLRTGTHKYKRDDFGLRRKHPLYRTWAGISQLYVPKGQAPIEWADFWVFVKDIGEKPEGNFRFTKKELKKPYTKNNWKWVAIVERDKSLTRQERNKIGAKEWHHKNPERAKTLTLRQKFSLDYNGYMAMLEKQNHLCAICLKPERSKHNKTNKIRSLAIDHCHASNKIRGLLCGTCNRGLGFFKDNIDVLQRAIDYLKTHALTA